MKESLGGMLFKSTLFASMMMGGLVLAAKGGVAFKHGIDDSAAIRSLEASGSYVDPNLEQHADWEMVAGASGFTAGVPTAAFGTFLWSGMMFSRRKETGPTPPPTPPQQE
jgi:hypothetical protein